MSVVTSDYLTKLPGIYRDILKTFPKLEPTRKAGYGLAYQSLYEKLEEQGYSLGDIVQACEKMQTGGAVTIEHRMFVHPTPLGEEMIRGLTGKNALENSVPEFPSLPTE